MCSHSNHLHTAVTSLSTHREVFVAVSVLLEMGIPHNLVVVWGQSLQGTSDQEKCIRVVLFPRQPVMGEPCTPRCLDPTVNEKRNTYTVCSHPSLPPPPSRCQGRLQKFFITALLCCCPGVSRVCASSRWVLPLSEVESCH